MTVIFDLDQTLINTHIAYDLRKNSKWQLVYLSIPNMTIYPYINQIINLLKASDVKLALVSSSPKKYCEKVLDYFDLKFDVIIGYHDTTLHKPYPDPYVKAMNSLGVSQTDVYALGDDPIDIVAARRSNIISIACGWGSYNLEALIKEQPDLFFNKPEELLNFFTIKTSQLI